MHLDDLLLMIRDDCEVFQHPVSTLVARYGDRYRDDVAGVLGPLDTFAALHGDTLHDALRFYAGYVEQVIDNRRHGAAASGAAIDDQQRRDREYLYALTLSTILNRCRYELRLDYRRALAAYGSRRITSLEIGAGNCLDAREAGLYGTVLAFEHNALSLQWRRILGLRDQIDLRIEEYRFDEHRVYDLVTMIELLEHLDDPRVYLEGVRRVLKDDGRAYLTFALRMPQDDHHYEFDSVDHCRDLLQEAGLSICHERCLIDTLEPFEEGDRWRLADDPRQAVVLCCLVRKQDVDEGGALLDAFNASVD